METKSRLSIPVAALLGAALCLAGSAAAQPTVDTGNQLKPSRAPAGIVSPRDAASGQATGKAKDERKAGPTSPGGPGRVKYGDITLQNKDAPAKPK